MKATEPFILPEDVLLFPVGELAPTVRASFTCQEDDYIISRPGSRETSLVIDANTAQFLEGFRQPHTIVDKVVAFALERELDPRELFEKVLPLLGRLLKARLLVSMASAHAEKIKPSLTLGSWLGEFQIAEAVQVLEDVEVYQVRRGEGETAALKICRQNVGQGPAGALEWEAAILRVLDGEPAPRLLADGWLDERRYLILKWCRGVNVSRRAAALRDSWTPASAPKLLELAITTAEAYARLHARGVVHGDVHPRNILVADNGDITLIDFGLAVPDVTPAGLPKPSRGGVGYYFEPEYALARLTAQPPPPANRLGEQYSLGALLYYLFTGSHYLDFRLEKETSWQQVAEQPMLPFTQRGLEPWPKLEAVLAKALAKKPEDRFPSLRDMAKALIACKTSLQPRANHYSPQGPQAPTVDPLVSQVLKRYDQQGTLITHGLPLAPTCSVNFGAAGIAYFLYRAAGQRGAPQWLAAADIWITRALREQAEARAFYCRELEITEKTVGNISLYHTRSGLYCTQALIAHAMGDGGTLSKALAGFVAASDQPCDNPDLTLGLSSTLIGCAILFVALSRDKRVDLSPVKTLGDKVLRLVWQKFEAQDATVLPFLGIAHGWAGVLYATLRWCQATGAPEPSALRPQLRELALLAQPSDKGLLWPRRPGDKVCWPGWCHGTAGYVHLWTQAHAVYQDDAYLDLAERAAWHTWQQTDRASGQLCCGLAGQSYALLNLYKHTAAPEWLQRAADLAKQAAALATLPSHRAHSLYKGDVGIALLQLDLAEPQRSCMPLFEAEG